MLAANRRQSKQAGTRKALKSNLCLGGIISVGSRTVAASDVLSKQCEVGIDLWRLLAEAWMGSVRGPGAWK